MHTTITVKTEKKLHRDAKKTAQKLGIPLTTVINALLKDFVREQAITVSVHPTPRPEKIAEWEKMSNDMARGVGINGPYTTTEELFAHWDTARTPGKKHAIKNA